MKIERLPLISFLFAVLIFSIALDMGGELGVRSKLLPVALILILTLVPIRLRAEHFLPFVLLVFYPTFLLMGAVVGKNDASIGLSQYQSTIFGFFLIVLISNIKNREFLIDKIVLAFVGVALVANILGLGLMMNLPFAADVVQTLSESKGGYFGERALADGALVSNIYFKSTLFFPSAFLLALLRRKYVASVLMFSACVLAVSKVAVIACLFIVIIKILWASKSKVILISSIGLFFVLTILLIDSPIFSEINLIFSGESKTLDARVGHLDSLISYWGAHPFYLIFGSGLGSSFYSGAAGAPVFNIEIDHLNSIRKYGLIWFLFFVILVIYCVRAALTSGSIYKKYVGWSVVVAFFVAGTNPVLISPVFFLLLALTMPERVVERNSLSYAVE